MNAQKCHGMMVVQVTPVVGWLFCGGGTELYQFFGGGFPLLPVMAIKDIELLAMVQGQFLQRGRALPSSTNYDVLAMA